MTIRSEIVEPTGLSEVQLGQWHELAERAVEPNPFFEPEFVLPHARAIDRDRAMRLLVVRDRSEWLACTPLSFARWHRIPLHSATTWHGFKLFSRLGTPLAAGPDPTSAIHKLVEAMLNVSRVRFAALSTIRADGPVAAAIAETQPSHGWLTFERTERAAIRKRPQPTYLEETVSKKKRQELRRTGRRLSEACEGELTVVDKAGHDSAYDEFIAVETAEPKAEERAILAADERHIRFFKDMCKGFAVLGRLQLPSLVVGGTTVAMQCNLATKSTLFGFKMTYDGRWRSYSPGIQLGTRVIDRFHHDVSLDLIDSCADPGNQGLNSLWPDRLPITTFAATTDGLTRPFTTATLKGASTLRDRLDRSRFGSNPRQ